MTKTVTWQQIYAHQQLIRALVSDVCRQAILSGTEQAEDLRRLKRLDGLIDDMTQMLISLRAPIEQYPLLKETAKYFANVADSVLCSINTIADKYESDEQYDFLHAVLDDIGTGEKGDDDLCDTSDKE